MLLISDKAIISRFADIEDSVRGSKIVIADGVVIDSFVKIKPAGGAGDVSIGERSHINAGVVIYSGNGIKIGNDVLIAANCTLAPTNHEFHARNVKIVEQRFMKSKGGIVIEDDVWIGANSIVLDGAIIRRGAVVGAGSLVKGELESFGVYGGNPIRLLTRRV